MHLKARLEFQRPIPLDLFIVWLMQQDGFDSEKAMVRLAKTTGQRPVLIIEEER